MKKLFALFLGAAFLTFAACQPKGPTPEELQKQQDSIAKVKADSAAKADSIAKIEAVAKAKADSIKKADSIAKLKPEPKKVVKKPVVKKEEPKKEEPKKMKKPGAK